MGKQSRRKKGRGGSKGKNHHRPTGLADDPGAGFVAPDDNSPVANVIKKVRHGDPRVRHAALVALSGTLYDSSSLTSAAKKKKQQGTAGGGRGNSTAAEANNPLLLRALSEKILDGDTPCAITAVGCLSNYVTFYCAEVGSDDSYGGGGESDEMEVTSDVMVPILLQRVQTSLGTITTLGNEMTSTATSTAAAAATDKSSAKKKDAKSNDCPIEKYWPSFTEQWSLLSLTLLTLSGLIENCPKAFQRMGANVFPQLMGVLPLATSSVDMMNGLVQKTKEGGESILDAATNALRALHSLLDDNASLISSLPVGSSAAAVAGSSSTPTLFSAISELTAVINNPNFDNMTRLHASGAVLSLRRVLVLDKEDTQETEMVMALQSCTNEVIVPMLQTLFQQSHNNEGSSTSPKQLVESMIDLSTKVSSQKQDEQLESSIVNDINTRKEPAREIARRQKKMKDEKEALKKQNQASGEVEAVQGMEEDESKEEAKVMEGGAAMVVEDDDSKVCEDDKNNNSSQQEDKREDFKQDLGNVVQSWRDIMGSYKLALEIVANLCCSQKDDDEEVGTMGDDEGVYDDDEHMWDSDDEAKLMAEAQASSDQSSGGAAVSPFEQATYNAMSNQAVQLPEQTLIFFRKWMEFLPQDHDSNDNGVPELVVEDVNELLATCALCLENISACVTMPTWSCAPMPLVLKSIGANAGASVENGLQLFWWGLVSILSTSNGYMGKNSSLHNVTSILLSLLRNQTLSRTLVDSATLDLLFNLLISPPQATSSSDDKNDVVLQMHCHLISMLGVLCSEPHPAEIDARVCSALLERLRSVMTDTNHDNNPVQLRHSIIITHEILNVLMDTYGCDDCHEEVFAKEKALDHFERCLPGFKRRIKKCRGEEDVHIWNETALNASRFIKYKKEG